VPVGCCRRRQVPEDRRFAYLWLGVLLSAAHQGSDGLLPGLRPIAATILAPTGWCRQQAFFEIGFAELAGVVVAESADVARLGAAAKSGSAASKAMSPIGRSRSFREAA
jgi:hypothetical protein